MDPNEIQQVRKIIESSTSKVSLRDLEKKGFRKVKVLRSNDIDELIRRAVTAVVAREGGDDHRVSEELVERSRQELKSLMSAAQAAEQERAEIIARNEELEQQVRDLARAATQVKELQRRLADAEEARQRAESSAAMGAASQSEDAARRAALERELDDARAKLTELTRKTSRGESEAGDLRRRVEEAEARAVALSKARDEAEDLRSHVKRLETEKRLVDELELPKLRRRIDELEAERKAAPAMAGGVAAGDMKAMFRELLQESGGLGGGDAMKAEFAKLQSNIAQQLASAGGRGGQVTEADLNAAKISIEALFKHDSGAAVESNIADVKVKESTTASDLKGKMDKLKALRKGGKSE